MKEEIFLLRINEDHHKWKDNRRRIDMSIKAIVAKNYGEAVKKIEAIRIDTISPPKYDEDGESVIRYCMIPSEKFKQSEETKKPWGLASKTFRKGKLKLEVWREKDESYPKEIHFFLSKITKIE